VNFRFSVQKIDRKLKKIEDINTYELKIKILKKENEDLKKQLKQN
jgi:cell shape-determining protein MreC